MTREEKVKFNKLVAKNVANILAARKITQRELAEMVGKREAEVSRWLTGRNGFSTESMLLPQCQQKVCAT